MKTLDELKALWNAQGTGDIPWNWDALGPAQMVAFAQKVAREDCARQLELTPADIRLMAGEMTAQEMRTVKAVLGGLRRRMSAVEPAPHASTVGTGGSTPGTRAAGSAGADPSTQQYEVLDRHILAAIRAGRNPTYDWHSSGEAGRIAKETGREGFRVIDLRLQALRRQGRIQYLTKGKAPDGKQGWRVVESETGQGA